MSEDKGVFVPCWDNPFSHTGKRNDLAEGMSTGCYFKVKRWECVRGNTVDSVVYKRRGCTLRERWRILIWLPSSTIVPMLSHYALRYCKSRRALPLTGQVFLTSSIFICTVVLLGIPNLSDSIIHFGLHPVTLCPEVLGICVIMGWGDKG